MAPPSPLSIATSSLLRLIKEEASYHRELHQQESRIQKLTTQPSADEEDNVEFLLRQERKALEETRAVFPPLEQRIADALGRLVELVGESGDGVNGEELAKAKDAVAVAQKRNRESAAVS
ncbi:MAG: hypothetical protein M1839_005638 [Geoglossum umbratile]|nr:MAG: hypothetical protein M1839_005638 [Geoglossum umbratile]